MRKILLAALLLFLATPAWGASITALSDFDLPSGQSIIFVGMIRAGSGAPDTIYDGRTNNDQLEAGSLLAITVGSSNLTIRWIRPQGTRIIVNGMGGLGFNEYFLSGQTHRDTTWHIQRDTDILNSVRTDAIATTDFGGGFMNIRNASFLAHARAITNNQLYIFALTMPSPPVACPYFGTGQRSLSDFRVGAAAVSKLYLGATVVCE